MRTSYYYLDTYPRSQRAIQKFQPDADWVYTTRGMPWLYPDDVASKWGQGDDLLIVEGDIVAGPMDYQLMESCPHGWCTAPYPLGTARTMFPFGYGFTKFNAKFQAGLPYGRVQDHHSDWVKGKVTCPPCDFLDHHCADCRVRMCHLHQDTYMWHTLMCMFGEGIQPHVHRPVEHLHFGNRQLTSFGKGVMYWSSPEPWQAVN